VLETQVEVQPIPLGFPSGIHTKLENVILPTRSISQVLQAWPANMDVVPFFAWVKPTEGVIQLEGRHWLFQFHGVRQISFLQFPPKERELNNLSMLLGA
jgi:hypothetical protein